MKHHFTLSERLAILVYQVLREGGLVGYDYTDMTSSEIQILPVRWNMPNWGLVENPIQRKFVFICDNPFESGEAQVKVHLAGHENERKIRDWRLIEVVVHFKNNRRKTISLPLSYEHALMEINYAEAELKKCKAKRKLFDLTRNCPFPTEVEKD